MQEGKKNGRVCTCETIERLREEKRRGQLGKRRKHLHIVDDVCARDEEGFDRVRQISVPLEAVVNELIVCERHEANASAPRHGRFA